ncbi:TlpA disulfide reductase family protein [Agrococcus sp. TF02-05]|uniref:TlpA family protein disulfide reductase n=1 Tax=Agrococcus sp. TF02-05 TaxID=2815211 RepID=UPI001AA11377|nr:TlpA disulfide reductase family protein [Agrococcus sp. TF02-05]MBO1769545.1 TlpA family protein disulfide reductase [Agrococcus sp. TF02-05]
MLGSIRRGLVAVGAAAALLLSGCASAAGPAGQARDAGYIAGDGIVTEIPQDRRTSPGSFSGPVATGGEFDSAELDGVALVNFWYAACPPCRVEAPVLAELHAEYGDRVDFIGINVRDGGAQATAFEEEFAIEYPSVLDDVSAQGQLAFAGVVAPNAVPSTIILDAEGRVAARVSGAVTDTSILSTLLREELER